MGVVTVEDGASVRLDVVNEFDPAIGPAIGPAGTGYEGLLPDTGAERGLWALGALGLLLVLAGGLLVTRAHRLRDG